MFRNFVILLSLPFLQTYERACIKKWLDAGHRTCPITQQILSSPILTPNHALYSLISNWCEANAVEPPRTRRLGNFWICKETSDGSSELINLDTLMRKITSSYIEDQRYAAGEHCTKHTHSSLSRTCTHTFTERESGRINSILCETVC
jgi:hypothetical protein